MILLALAAAAFHPNPGAFDSPPRTPSPAALASALTSFSHRPVNANDVRSIQCEGLFYSPPLAPLNYACRWDQKVANGWRGYSSFFGFKRQRWALTQKPETDLPVNPASAEERRFRQWLIPHLRNELADADDKLTFRYGYAFVDLNDDGHDEAIVTVFGGFTCGTGGCVMFVESEHDGAWRELSSTFRTREPIQVLSTKHHGWHDIGVVDGGGGLPRTIESPVIFTGRAYDDSPTDDPVPRNVHGRTVLTETMVNRPLF